MTPKLHRYRIQNKKGNVLCHVDTAQQAANVVTGLGEESIGSYYVEDLKHGVTYPFTTYARDLGTFWIGTSHKERPQ